MRGRATTSDNVSSPANSRERGDERAKRVRSSPERSAAELQGKEAERPKKEGVPRRPARTRLGRAGRLLNTFETIDGLVDVHDARTRSPGNPCHCAIVLKPWRLEWLFATQSGHNTPIRDQVAG